MGRAFEYRKATKLKRWGQVHGQDFTRLGKQIAIAVKSRPVRNPKTTRLLRGVIATCKREKHAEG